MKKCSYCGMQNEDSATICEACQTPLTPEASALARARSAYAVSPQEIRFWEKMTFRTFAVLMIRLQALWLFFNAVIELTYVPKYMVYWVARSSFPTVSPEATRELGWLILRIAVHIAAGVVVIVHAERLLSWIVKDYVAAQPAPEVPPKIG